MVREWAGRMRGAGDRSERARTRVGFGPVFGVAGFSDRRRGQIARRRGRRGDTIRDGGALTCFEGPCSSRCHARFRVNRDATRRDRSVPGATRGASVTVMIALLLGRLASVSHENLKSAIRSPTVGARHSRRRGGAKTRPHAPSRARERTREYPDFHPDGHRHRAEGARRAEPRHRTRARRRHHRRAERRRAPSPSRAMLHSPLGGRDARLAHGRRR